MTPRARTHHLPGRLHTPQTAIDFGGAIVRAIETCRRAEHRTLTLPREEPGTPYTENEIGFLIRSLRRVGFRARSVLAVLPKMAVRVLPIELPPRAPAASLREIARAQAAELTGLPAGMFEVAITTHADGDRPSSAAVCDHETTRAFIDGFASAKSTPAALFPPATPLIAAASRTAPAEASSRWRPDADRGLNPLSLMIDAGWTNTTILAMRDGRSVLERHITALGFGRVLANLAAALGCDQHAARILAEQGRHTSLDLASACAPHLRAFGLELEREIDATSPYLSQITGETPCEIILTGGACDDDELVDWLDASTTVPVRVIRTEAVSGSPATLAALLPQPHHAQPQPQRQPRVQTQVRAQSGSAA
ncbi:MAG: hypothetical protein AAF235_08015 [Planctomycetota bacterium]